MESPRTTPERSKPTLPPKPALLINSSPSIVTPECSRRGDEDPSGDDPIADRFSEHHAHQIPSTKSETMVDSSVSRSSCSTVVSKNALFLKNSNSSPKPPILPKPAHLKSLRNSFQQTSPVIPNKSNLNVNFSAVNRAKSEIFYDSKSIRHETSLKSNQIVEVVESKIECITLESSCNVRSETTANSFIDGSQIKIFSESSSTGSSSEEILVCDDLGEQNVVACSDPGVSNFDSHSSAAEDNNESSAIEYSESSCDSTISAADSQDVNLVSESINVSEVNTSTKETHCVSPLSSVLNDLEAQESKLEKTSLNLCQTSTCSSLNRDEKKEEIDSGVQNSNCVTVAPESKSSENCSDANTSKCSKTNQSDGESVGSDTSGSYTMKQRLSSWFSSFGKGHKGRQKKRRSFTLYSDSSNGEDATKSICDDSSVSNVSGEESKNSNGNRSSMSDESLENELAKVSNQEDKSNETDEPQQHFSCSKEKKAFLVAKELMTSERVFINALKLICCDFVKFVHNCGVNSCYPVLLESDLEKVIGSLPQLLLFNELLLQDFESRIHSWGDVPKIADVIVKKGPFLKLYTSYYQNFQSQCEFLDECCSKYPRFRKALKDFESSDVCKKLTLKHYMLKPIQRIPQYRLLLKDYLLNLDTESEDYKDTQQALQVVCDVANHANKSLKQGDHLSKLLQIQTQLDSYEIVKPGREFVKEGELYKLSRKSLQLRFLILLNDTLILTSYYGSMTGLKLNHELPLSGMKVCVPQTEDYHNEFSVITTTRSFSLRARTQIERQEWVETLESTIKAYIERQLSFMNLKTVPTSITQNGVQFFIGKEAPVWIPDGRVTMCQSCTAEFTMTFRRHHCRACGKVVCGNCSNNKAPLQYMKFQADRVCEECYNILVKEFEEPSRQLYEAIQTQFSLSDHSDVVSALKDVCLLFKKAAPSGSKKSKKIQEIPQRLREVMANDSGSQMSGWLLYQKDKRSWKRFWFVLKDQALYFYKASEDVRALGSIAVLGYEVKNISEDVVDVSDPQRVFQLIHRGRKPITFCADNRDAAKRWMKVLDEATVLK